MTHHIPMRIQRRGIEMRMVIEGPGCGSAKADPILLRAIARARTWCDELTSGQISSLAAIAKREGLSDSYIAHLMPLAFLAPDIVEAMVAGTQPADLTADTLIKRIDLPLDWDEQKTLLGMT